MNEREYENLLELVKKGMGLEDFVAVRCCKREPEISENKLYPMPIRPTIHFALNHMVEPHIYGSWEDSELAIIIPLKDLLEKNRERTYGGVPVDFFFVGPIELPETTVKIKGEGGNLRNVVNETIERMGYKILPGGTRTWGPESFATPAIEFVRLMKRYNLGTQLHCDTSFYYAERLYWKCVGKILRENFLDSKRFSEMSEFEKEIRESVVRPVVEGFGKERTIASLRQVDTIAYENLKVDWRNQRIDWEPAQFLWQQAFRKETEIKREYVQRRMKEMRERLNRLYSSLSSDVKEKISEIKKKVSDQKPETLDFPSYINELRYRIPEFSPQLEAIMRLEGDLSQPAHEETFYSLANSLENDACYQKWEPALNEWRSYWAVRREV